MNFISAHLLSPFNNSNMLIFTNAILIMLGENFSIFANKQLKSHIRKERKLGKMTFKGSHGSLPLLIMV